MWGLDDTDVWALDDAEVWDPQNTAVWDLLNTDMWVTAGDGITFFLHNCSQKYIRIN